MKPRDFSRKGGKGIFPVLLVLLITASSFTDDLCKSFYPMEKGKKFELTHFNPKDKVESRVKYEVVDKSESGDVVSATIRMTGFDKKDEQVFDGDYKVYCENGVFKVDIKSMLNAAQLEQLESMEEMDVSIESEDLEMPSRMSAGDELKDGKINISVTAQGGGMALMNMTTQITDRKVVSEEKMTTPAGTFDCVVISSVVQSKTGFISISYDSKEWYAENVGLVRSETYRKGKLEGYTLLTSLN